MKSINNYLLLFVIMNLSLCANAQKGHIRESFIQKQMEWTKNKVESVKQSIRKYPWRYASGVLALSTVVGYSIYRFKKVPVFLPLPQISQQRPLCSIPTRPNAPASPVIAPGVFNIWPKKSPLHEPTLRSFVENLKNAVTQDLFKVESLIELRDFNGFSNLDTMKIITQTNHIASLHDELSPIKETINNIYQVAINPSQNENDLQLLKGLFNQLQQKILNIKL